MTSLAIFVSGSGTNCENLIKHFASSDDVHVALVLSNRPDAFALERARRLGVPTEVVPKADLNTPEVVLSLLKRYKIDFIVLAGFLPIVPGFLIDAYPGRIVNLHPALLPKFGGKGMYGHKVHEAVKAAGERMTGMTVHYVTGEVDGGPIIMQFSTPISPEDTVEDIAEKEHRLEMEYFPGIIDNLIHKI